MNEYLTTFLAEDHRSKLLAEARAEALAHEALAGRPSWWHRLFYPFGRCVDRADRDVCEPPHGRERDEFPLNPPDRPKPGTSPDAGLRSFPDPISRWPHDRRRRLNRRRDSLSQVPDRFDGAGDHLT